ncbi:MAG: CarD family transcriptional regulator [bacterium]|nr:CarD family transcriptional regulator [bacterium]
MPKLLIASITPYFLEKGNVWFEENFQKLADARKTQPFFEENTLFLVQNQTYSLSEVLRKLDELGYEKVFSVSEPGEFTIRGGLIELFPINTNNAFRLEFLGNKVEHIEQLPLEVKDETKAKEILQKRLKSQKLFSDITNVKEGDYLVHLDHGVGVFQGMNEIQGTNYYLLEYASGDKLYVPTGLERKLSRYVGFSDPRVSRLSSPFWIKTKRRIKEEVEKLAKQLLELYAKREVATRTPYTPSSDILKEAAATFPFEETPDQKEALEDIEKDLETQNPMDRLVCGDVGFGKTEIALRTMVRALEQGYQSALLAPTTILAYQHFQNFKARLRSLPLNVALLSRIQTAKEQKDILKGLQQGAIDMVIGTHRLLSKDVEFKNLGLLVVDDEQRFGVKQKEKLRELRTSLDVLSLSATPIPRTLYMSLSSLKNISIIQTPPPGRTAVETTIGKWNQKTVKQAVLEELKRKGQAYYLHNRIGTIEGVKKLLQKIVPEATFGVAHGRMDERQLIRMMDDFKNKKFDVLLATTIIENGLDLPNVNTLLVADATNLGLAQAYQIRGRIGRSHKKAHAYFLYPSRLSGNAKLRLKALQEAQEPGSGYRIALRDLEIRGAGNILGKEQSGNVSAIGLNLYCQMLSEAVEKLKQ